MSTLGHEAAEGSTAAASDSLTQQQSAETTIIAATTRIHAAPVSEAQMFQVLRAAFEEGDFEVELHNDVYIITTPRKLTEEELKNIRA
ncbi:hypothetical protein B0T24DRAFT_681394 [Lasiosphaeria ovina]|uniref:Uncharacterized protein n=1 Tax=Lasiosphaeria ovina TaxID=92902 RepID=A0AAE0K4N8_9PEZI|nr:hypothetical protein B0T24DRAFT_681394 [Lasiosphaeria ovina]